MPCANLAEIGNGVMTMHRRFHVLIDKVERFEADPRVAYENFLRIANPNREIPQAKVDQLLAMAPTIPALMRIAATEEGKMALKRLLGKYTGARMGALLDRGRI